MARKSPKQTLIDLQTVLDAVTELAPEKSFGGIDLIEYSTQVGKSVDARGRIVDAEAQVVVEINKRDGTDDEGMKMRKLIVNGIIGDPDFGPNSTLYERCGYIREDDRKSGLTRKGKKEDK